MKKTSEKSIEKQLKRRIEAEGGLCLKFWCLSMAGMPDRICLLPGGRIIFVELKGPGAKPSPVQRVIHARLRSLGFIVEVIDSMDGINALIYDL